MIISVAQIQHIAKLARLKTEPQQTEFYAAQLARIMTLVEQMNAIDTDGVEPMSHPRDVALRMRADTVSPTVPREALQAIAPAVQQGLYLVPQVIE